MGVKDSFLGRLLSSSDKFSEEQVAQTVALFLEHALAREASAVHIEPQGRTAAVRYRIGGKLHGLHVIPAAALPAIARNMRRQASLGEPTVTPQEGSYRIMVASQPVEIRVSIMPVLGGDKIVLHLSQMSGRHQSLESLGFWGENLRHIHANLVRSQGLVLVASPKHSLRPSTLYGLLQLLHTPSASLATVEDRIERELKGVTQTRPAGTHHEATADSIRTLLRHDPNVIMVSNLPNKPAIQEVVNASHSGHLVLGGLYADNATQAALHIHRLGIEPYLLATSLRLVIGQRTARKLCTACRERYTPAASHLTRLNTAFGMTNATNRGRVHELEQEASATIGMGLPINSTPTHITHLWRANPDGCELCFHTGYQGVTLLTEVLPMDQPIYRTIESNATAQKLQSEAIKHGFIPMGLDGLIKALRGETTVTEVLRTAQTL